MRQQIRQAHLARQPHRQVTGIAPLREPLVQRNRVRLHRIAKRLEQFPQNRLPAPTRHRRQLHHKRQRHGRQLRPMLRPPVQRRAKHLAQGNAQKRRRRIRPVIHVPGQRKPVRTPTRAPHQPNRVHLHQQRGGTTGVGGLREEHVRLTERERHRPHVVRVLLQQEAKVSRRLMSSGDSQQHGGPPFKWTPIMTDPLPLSGGSFQP